MSVAKLKWAKVTDSERQLRDVLGIIQTQGEGLDVAYIEKWVDRLGLGDQWKAVQHEA